MKSADPPHRLRIDERSDKAGTKIPKIFMLQNDNQGLPHAPPFGHQGTDCELIHQNFR